MRPLFALLLFLYAHQAYSVTVSGTFNGSSIPLPCEASDIQYRIDARQFAFSCNGLNYVCEAPSGSSNWVQYLSNNQLVNLNCINGSALGLQVDITNLDGARSYCAAASNVAFAAGGKSFSWSCGEEALSCFPRSTINLNVSGRMLSVDQCSSQNPEIYSDGFE